MNYFSFYGLTPKMDIDSKVLRDVYHSKMMSLHPDMHMMADAAEKEALLTQSSYNNAAYNTLRDFHSRLKYVLEEYGTSSEEKASLPQMFLMEMMDVNEEIMELQMSMDVDKLVETRTDVEGQLDTMQNDIEILTQKLVLDNGLNEAQTKQISEYLLKRNYLNRILTNLDKIESEA